MRIEELDREKCENSSVDFSKKRSLRISEVVDELELSEKSVNNQSQGILRILIT